jgi:hypothetical protein
VVKRNDKRDLWNERILKTMQRMIISLLLVMFIIKSANAEERYSNPVLVESITIVNTNAGANQFTETMGIGDPAVIFHEEKYYLYPTGDNRGYDVYVSSDLIN